MAGPGLLLPWPHWAPAPQLSSPSPRIGLCEGAQDLKGNLPLALMPLIAPVSMDKFLVLNFFTHDQVKQGLNQEMSLRDVSAGSSGRTMLLGKGVSVVSQDMDIPPPLPEELRKWLRPPSLGRC